MSDKLKALPPFDVEDFYYMDGDIKTSEEVTLEAVEEVMNNQFELGRQSMADEMNRGAVAVGVVIIAAAFAFGATFGILLF